MTEAALICCASQRDSLVSHTQISSVSSVTRASPSLLPDVGNDEESATAGFQVVVPPPPEISKPENKYLQELVYPEELFVDIIAKLLNCKVDK